MFVAGVDQISRPFGLSWPTPTLENILLVSVGSHLWVKIVNSYTLGVTLYSAVSVSHIGTCFSS